MCSNLYAELPGKWMNLSINGLKENLKLLEEHRKSIIEDINHRSIVKCSEGFYYSPSHLNDLIETLGCYDEEIATVKRCIEAKLNDCNDDEAKYHRKLQTLENNREKKRKMMEETLRESMNAEGCELISEYKTLKTPIYYLYDGLKYQTTAERWNKGKRPHLR